MLDQLNSGLFLAVFHFRERNYCNDVTSLLESQHTLIGTLSVAMLTAFSLDSWSSHCAVSMLHLGLSVPPTRRLVPMHGAAMHGAAMHCAAMHGAAMHCAAMHGAAGGGDGTPSTNDPSAGVMTSVPEHNLAAMRVPVDDRAAVPVPVDDRSSMPVHDAGDLDLGSVDGGGHWHDWSRHWVDDLCKRCLRFDLLAPASRGEHAYAGRVPLAHA